MKEMNCKKCLTFENVVSITHPNRTTIGSPLFDIECDCIENGIRLARVCSPGVCSLKERASFMSSLQTLSSGGLLFFNKEKGDLSSDG